MKKILVLLITLSFTWNIYSQDGFGSIFDSDDISTAGTVDQGKSSIKINGKLGFSYKSYLNDSWNSERIISPYSNLELMIVSDSVEAKISMNIDAADLDSNIKMDNLIDELYLRSFFSFGYLDLGLLKTEWGKGDEMHVIDPLNPLDQTNGPLSDINEMKRPEIMAKMNFYIGDGGLLELVYKPYYHSVETASEGRWIIKDLPFPLEPSTLPDTENPSYSQAAARFTTTAGIFDLGASYYYGFMTEPGYKITYTNPVDLSTYRANITNTKAQLFGLEAGWAVGPFTFRTEGGYWLSEDHGGTEPSLYNDRAVWLAGFDIMIPGTPVFLSVQEFGSYVFNFDSSNPMDVDLGMSYKKNAMTNTVIAALEGKFYQDKMKIRLAGLYLFEANGYMVLPTYTWNIEDDLELEVSSQIFGGEDEGPNPYYAWRNNDSITLSLKYIY